MLRIGTQTHDLATRPLVAAEAEGVHAEALAALAGVADLAFVGRASPSQVRTAAAAVATGVVLCAEPDPGGGPAAAAATVAAVVAAGAPVVAVGYDPPAVVLEAAAAGGATVVIGASRELAAVLARARAAGLGPDRVVVASTSPTLADHRGLAPAVDAGHAILVRVPPGIEGLAAATVAVGRGARLLLGADAAGLRRATSVLAAILEAV